MKTTVSIYKGSVLMASKEVKTKKEESDFIKSNFPVMKMTEIVNDGWKIVKK